MSKYLFKIRCVNEYSVSDFLNDRINASVPAVFDDESECEYNYDVVRLSNRIYKCYKKGKITNGEYEILFENYKEFRRDKKGLTKLLNELIDPKDIPLKKSLFVSCLSNTNFVNNSHMMRQYTNKKPKEGIVIVYDKDAIINECNKMNIKYGNINYAGRDAINLDLTDYWYDWLMCFMKTVDYSKTTGNKNLDMILQMLVTGKALTDLGKNYINDDDLVLIKDKKWKYQNEFRIFKENDSYSRMNDFYEKAKLKNKGKAFQMYGCSIIVKPKAIFLKKDVCGKYKDQIVNYALKNGIEVYSEDEDDTIKFYRKYN